MLCSGIGVRMTTRSTSSRRSSSAYFVTECRAGPSRLNPGPMSRASAKGDHVHPTLTPQALEQRQVCGQHVAASSDADPHGRGRGAHALPSAIPGLRLQWLFVCLGVPNRTIPLAFAANIRRLAFGAELPGVCALILNCAQVAPVGNVDELGFEPLLSPSAVVSWRQCGPGQFAVTNGVATGHGGMGLWWYGARQFTNFVLRGEFVQEGAIADSGVFVRFPDPGNDPWIAVHQGHEMEIGDPEPKDPTWRTGSIYPFAASKKANTKPLGQWNSYELTCIGQTYTVRINGEVVTEWMDPKHRTEHGFIGLQNYNDGKTVRHRNLRVKNLP